MEHFNLHPDFYNKPILLTENEQQEPLLVIRGFFDDSNLVETRIHLSNLLEVALTKTNSIYDEASERDTVCYFCIQFMKVLEAGYLLSRI